MTPGNDDINGQYAKQQQHRWRNVSVVDSFPVRSGAYVSPGERFQRQVQPGWVGAELNARSEFFERGTVRVDLGRSFSGVESGRRASERC